MARKSTIEYAKRVLSPAQFKAWKAMPLKLSKSELAAGKRPGGKQTAPWGNYGPGRADKIGHEPLESQLREILWDLHEARNDQRGGETGGRLAGKTDKQLQNMAEDIWRKENSKPAKKKSAKKKPAAGRGAAIAFVKHATGRDTKKGINPWTVARDYAREQGRTEAEARAWAACVVKGLTPNPARKSRKGKRLPTNRKKIRKGATVSWVDVGGRTHRGVVYQTKAKTSTVVDSTTMRYGEHYNGDLHPYKQNCGRRRRR